MVEGPYDVSLVEGSVTTPHDAERIQEVRQSSRFLVAIGACATAGGIQALRNFTAVDELASVVYAHPEYLSTLESSTPISAHVPVDFELRGCPVDRGQLLEVLTALLRHRKPDIRASSVCLQCKRRGNVCVMVAHGTACLGPVTQAGCGAICPSFERGCYGCFGPMETPNTTSLSSRAPRRGAGRRHRDAPLPHVQRHRAGLRDGEPSPGEGGRTSVTHQVRDLTVEGLSRVEGEGAMHVVVTDGKVTDVRLRIFEPPRFFEAFLRGRSFTEPPDITARICGICPVAYQMSSCQAIEQACGAVIDPPLRALRRLLYCGEWIESHVLHIYFLHAPDFLGVGSALELAKDHRELVEKALKLKKIGNDLMEVVGGRAIHPINVRLGGFYRVPTKRELLPFVERLRWARDASLETLELVSTFDFPDLEIDHELVALHHPDEYAITEGRIVSDGGLDIEVAEFLRALRRGARLPLDRAARPDDREGPLPGRAAGALQPQLRPAPRGGPGRRRGRWTRQGVPEPLPEHPGPGGRDGGGLRRGAADHRGVLRAGAAGRADRAAGRAWATEPPRRRAASCTTATTSTTRA